MLVILRNYFIQIYNNFWCLEIGLKLILQISKISLLGYSNDTSLFIRCHSDITHYLLYHRSRITQRLIQYHSKVNQNLFLNHSEVTL